MNGKCACGSYAINQALHGRKIGVDADLCDVCYWRKRAEGLRNPRHPDPVKDELVEALNNLLQWANHVKRRVGARLDDPHTGAIAAAESILKKVGVQD